MTSSKLDVETGKSLAALLDLIIPPCRARGMPGGSEVGFPSYMGSENLVPWVLQGLRCLDDASSERHGRRFHGLSQPERLALVEDLKRSLRPFFSRLAKQLAECYYQNPDVARTIGLPDSPPFPDGYRVEDGDLTLLESVYLRGKIYRDP